MVVLRADPWAPEYGMGFQAREEEPPPLADPTVETDDWAAPISPPPGPPAPVWFVDGVRRVDLRLLADDGSRRAAGLFGSFAVGAVCCDGGASFADHVVGRAVIAAAGILPPAVEVPMGSHLARYVPATDPFDDPDRPVQRLQQLMLEEEAVLAASAATEPGRLVVVDGPLRFFDATSATVVGMVKRFVRHYLDPGREGLLGRLATGDRTPLFALGLLGQPVQRYAWYTRLVDLRAPWHDQAGIVRCEVRAGVGIEQAIRLADGISAMLPRFAGRPSDPRAPQNLAPVGGLEAWLRHRMGDVRMVRRALIEWLAEGA